MTFRTSTRWLGRWLGMMALLTAAGCGESKSTPHRYLENDLQLITQFTAKTVCSCVFVMGQTEEYCKAYAYQNPAVATFQVDWHAKAVRSSALLLWGARAHYVDEHFGCVLE